MKKSKRIAKLANEIVELERKRETMDDVSAIEAKIEKIMSGLTADEVFEIDAYISEKNLLT